MFELPPYSYKDPAAVVIKREGEFHRLIHQQYISEYQHLMESGLYQELTDKNLLIPHEEFPGTKLPEGYVKELKPVQLDYHILPFEWSFSQWKKCIIAYLQINQIALQYGMVLKDATPYNFSMFRGNALLFDTSSFIFFKDKSPWISYRQFCEEFLAPFTLMKFNGSAWSRIYRSHIKGLPLEFVSKQLPVSSYFYPSILVHLHWHSRFQPQDHAENREKNVRKGFSKQSLLSLFKWIEKSLLSWEKPYQFNTHWSSYYEKSIESPIYLKHKKEQIESWIKQTKPQSLSDLGANNGEFSLIAASHVPKVIAIESASNCVDDLDTLLSKHATSNIYPVVADLTQMSPDLGNNFQEFPNLGKRGKSEMTLALAIVHHLCITNHYSISQVISLVGLFCEKYLIIEFVPLEDSKAQTLQKQMGMTFPNYHLDAFRSELAVNFDIKQEVNLKDSTRTLFLATRK